MLLHCPDKQGILAVVTEFINNNNGNIIYLDQYVDTVQGVFFMRVEWELDGFLIPKEKLSEYFQTLLAKPYDMVFNIYFHKQKPRMALFVSKQAHCLYDLLAHYEAGDWNVEIPLIVSNHPDLEHVAKKFGIPFFVFPINKDNKEEQEQKELDLLHENNVSCIVLARYMQIISPRMIAEYPEKIINIHHSFLPAFIGAKPYQQAFDRGVKIIGATAHFVTDNLDEGPIIEQDVIKVNHRYSAQSMARAGRDVERLVLMRALNKILSDKVFIHSNKTVVF